MGRQQGYALGEVDRRSAADGDQAVAVPLPVQGERCFDRFFGRVGWSAGEDGQIGAGTDHRRNFPDQPGLRHAFVGDYQWLADAQFGEVLLDAAVIVDQLR